MLGMSYGWGEGGVEACGNLNSRAKCLSFILGATRSFSKFSDRAVSHQIYIFGDFFSCMKKRERLLLRGLIQLF